MPHIIDGKKYAAQIYQTLAPHISDFKIQYHGSPHLAIVSVGTHSASQVYIKRKLQSFEENGLKVTHLPFDAHISETDLAARLASLNNNPDIHGIILQLPLPLHLNTHQLCNAIDPCKDVDGLTVTNQGRLMQGDLHGLYPCTPLGCLLLLKSLGIPLRGKRGLVIGRSILVGRPMGLLLLNEDVTVTFAHTRTQDLPAHVKESDIIVAALGKPHAISQDWIKNGAIVLDVGINKIQDTTTGKSSLTGDVASLGTKHTNTYITPVPGGVGPMTVACLFYNTYKAALAQKQQKETPYDFQRFSQNP